MKKKLLIAAIAGFVFLVILFALGPRPRVEAPIGGPDLPGDLDEYLAEREGRFTDIVPETQKRIAWANEERNQTPLSIVYLHGYSASRQDIAPLNEHLARQLGANLYEARLTGHGRSGEAMGQATAEDWLGDALEAMAIGRQIGERVIVIGFSTGGTLAAWLASLEDREAIAAVVLLSPNFAPRPKAAELLTWPWARQVLLPLAVGPEIHWPPLNERMAMYWTESYPSVSLIEMMSLVKYIRRNAPEKIDAPVLVIYSPHDAIVDPGWTKRAFARIGSDQKKIVAIEESTDPIRHALAGETLAPDDTERIEAIIFDFLQDTL